MNENEIMTFGTALNVITIEMTLAEEGRHDLYTHDESRMTRTEIKHQRRMVKPSSNKGFLFILSRRQRKRRPAPTTKEPTSRLQFINDVFSTAREQLLAHGRQRFRRRTNVNTGVDFPKILTVGIAVGTDLFLTVNRSTIRVTADMKISETNQSRHEAIRSAQTFPWPHVANEWHRFSARSRCEMYKPHANDHRRH